MAKRKPKKKNPHKAESDNTVQWKWKAEFEAQKKRHKEFHKKQKGKKK